MAPRSKLLRLVKWCPSLPKIFLLTLLLPSDWSFYLGPLRLTLYRLVLILALFPALSRVFSGKSGRVNAIDKLVLAHIAWSCFVIAYFHGLEVCLQSGGIRFIEYAGAYFLARAYVTDERTYQGIVAAIIMTIALLCPFVIFESITGINLIRKFASGGSFSSDIETRMGLHRAFGSFDHPILLGVWAASALSISWVRVFPRLGSPKPRKWPSILVALTALASMSSGATSALMAQLTLMLWDIKTRIWKGRWRILVLLMLAMFITIELLSNRSAMLVLLSYLTFSEENAYGRTIIFEWGMKDVYNNPILGIGFNEWSHPSFMSSSMDNFWLVQAVSFGIPGFLTFALPSILVLTIGWGTLPPRLTRLRRAWAISMLGLIIAACTVHFWNQSFSYYAFFLGTGVWFMNVRREANLEPGVVTGNHAKY